MTTIPQGNITKSILNRQYSTQQQHLIIPPSHPIALKPYRSASIHPRKILKTEVCRLTNPVYDVKYSPVCYPSWRVLAVGDEQGWLSVVRVGFEGGRRVYRGIGGLKCVECCGGKVWNRGVTKFNTTPCNSEGHEDLYMQPVLYSVDWNWGGDKVLAGYGDGSIRIWDVVGGCHEPLSLVQAYEKSIKRVVWGSEATLISCSRTNEIRVHDNRMRNPLVNRIDTGALSCKLTDIALLSDHHVASCSSNQSGIHLWDLRYTYKLYKRIKPVSSFDAGSAVVCLGVDRWGGEGERVFYSLGVDGCLGEVRWGESEGRVVKGWGVPGGGVDYFSRMDVSSGVVVCGGSGESAWGFDVRGKRDGDSVKGPFFELREGKTFAVSSEGEEEVECCHDDRETNKENVVVVANDGFGGEGNGRCCSAVAIGTRRGNFDCAVQIATGGDDSHVTVWD